MSDVIFLAQHFRIEVSKQKLARELCWEQVSQSNPCSTIRPTWFLVFDNAYIRPKLKNFHHYGQMVPCHRAMPGFRVFLRVREVPDNLLGVDLHAPLCSAYKDCQRYILTARPLKCEESCWLIVKYLKIILPISHESQSRCIRMVHMFYFGWI